MSKTAFVILRISPELKKRIVKRAAELGQNVSQVVRDIIDESL